MRVLSADRRVPLIVLVVASLALLSSVAWALMAGRGRVSAPPWQGGPMMGPGYGPMMDPQSGPIMGSGYGPMMGPGGSGMVPGIAGSGPVADIDSARTAAQRLADRWGLRVGEVMQFSNGYYAELLDSSGNLATEVLVDPSGGAVMIEHGPAMMWNTAYGMMPGRAQQGAPSVNPEQARTIADRWLAQHRSGMRAGEAEAFPGYYTLHTLRGDQIEGMMSVNANSGAVWYHTWHGQFVRMQEPAGR